MKSLKSVFLFISFSSFTLLFSSCDRYKTMQLLGEWNAIEVKKNNQHFNVPLEEIKLSFSKNCYTYQGTLLYKEAGHYYLSSPYLYTKDTLNANTLEKAVEIIQLNADTLEILMDQDGEEMILKMVKK